MTPEELEKLRAMTRAEVFLKYTPLLMRKKVTHEQYDWLFTQARRDPRPVDPHELTALLLESFGGRIVDKIS